MQDTEGRPDVQSLYRSSTEGVRGSFGTEGRGAVAYYQPLVDFVVGVDPPRSQTSDPSRLLDVGCGVAWSTFAFVQAGYRATGMDLNHEHFQPPTTDGLALVQASALDLPFASGAFDTVVTYQCIEHVPDPGQVLREMLRVCKSGGVVCVVGPNLASPSAPLVNLGRALSRRSTWREVRFRRTASMPRHPYGNTVGENLKSVLINSGRLAAKLLRSEPHFTMRRPDTVPPFHADNDSTYLCNPIDIIKFFRKEGCAILRSGRPGRLPLSHLFAGGTWVAARKP